MRGYETTQSGLSFLYKTIQGYQEPGIIFYAALVLLIIAAIFGGRKVRCVFFWPVLILALTLFNPYLFPYLFVKWPSLIEQYYSGLWTIPTALIIGASAAVLAWRFRAVWAKFLVLFAAAALLIAGAVPAVNTYRHIVIPSNFMKADAELVTLCDYVAEKSESDHPKVAFEREDFALEAAAYDADLRISDLFAGEEQDTLGQTNGEQFIIIRKENKELGKQLKSAGFRAVASTPDSLVFVPRE